MKFDIPLDTNESDGSHMDMFKSWRSFSRIFEGARRMRVITYCDSPEFILDLFEDLENLECLEVIVGDIDDYRERLIDKPDLADRLEQLRRDHKLVIYLCENKQVHTKLYLIEYLGEDQTDEGSGGDDQVTLDRGATTEPRSSVDTSAVPAKVVIGSPNLSRNAWSNQTNIGVVYDTTIESDLYADFEDLYYHHRDSYNKGGPFLKDLSEQLEQSDDDREEVIKLYTEGRMGTKDELGEVHSRLTEHIDAEVETEDLSLNNRTTSDGEHTQLAKEDKNADEPAENLDPNLTGAPQDRITLSLRGYDESTVNTLSKMTDFDATVSNDILTTTPDAFQRYAQQIFDIPTMHLNEDMAQLKFHCDGTVYRVTKSPKSPERVDKALAEIENYFATVDDYGNSDDDTAVKAHMYEALLWFFWAPFANRQATFYRQHGINLDKAFPYLYIFGESNGGKGTFCRFALSLISGNRVEAPVDADEIGKRKVRNLRSAHTSFPVIVDDITKEKVNSLGTLRNYWSGWTGETSYPMFAFISNDKRPDKWFRNRAKILRFDINFTTSHQGEARVNRLIDTENPIFQWFGHEYLNRDLALGEDSDALREVREVMLNLYEFADRSVPDYFPSEPAEQAYDSGRERWHNLLDREDIEISENKDTLQVTFPESMSFELHEYKRDPPMTVRVEKQGPDLIIKTPDEFFDWFGETTTGNPRGGFLSRARNLLSR